MTDKSSLTTLKIKNFSLNIHKELVIKNINLTAQKGEIVFVLGISGAGKSTLLRSIARTSINQMQPSASRSKTAGGQKSKNGRKNQKYNQSGLIEVFGKVGFVYQNSALALSPSAVVKSQALEALNFANIGLKSQSSKEKNRQIDAIFKSVGMEKFTNFYPQHLSGGGQVRCLIAINLCLRAKVLLLDEPLSSVHAESLECIKQILLALTKKPSSRTTLIWATHNMDLLKSVGRQKDLNAKVIVLSKGEIVESASLKRFLSCPSSIAGKKLLSPPQAPLKSAGGGAVICEFKDVSAGYEKLVLKGLSFKLQAGEILGILGDSGVGKTTLLKILQGRLKISSGTVICPNSVQAVFQNPASSLNPSLSVFDSVSEPISHIYDRETIEKMVYEKLKTVFIDPKLSHLPPTKFSGGQCQRICIARAIISHPKLLLLDEITSQLDSYNVSNILKILQNLQQTSNVGMLFVSHNKKVLQQVCNKTIMIEKIQTH